MRKQWIIGLLILLPLAGMTQELNVLSWNIKFLPRVLAHIGHRPLKRVPYIAEYLLKDSADVIVFQEAFDNVANRRLLKLLKEKYPYHIGPANKKGAFKISSGILIVSKIPMRERATVDFKDCEKEDCFARKGALLVEINWHGRLLHILGTHLEAGGPREIKLSQYQELAGLLRAHQNYGVPQLLCGDFNTAKTDQDLYPKMLTILQAEDGPLAGELKYTSDHVLNDMCPKKSKEQEVIDYILYKGNGVQPMYVYREVVRPLARWNKKHQDLSDHFGVRMRIRF